MAQINLLGSQEKKTDYSKVIFSMIAKGLAVVLVALLLYYGYLIIRGRSYSGKITEMETEIARTQQTIQQNEDRNELFTRQAQLKDLSSLLSQHVYWSGIVPDLARVTLRSADYTSFAAKDNGDIVMVVDVPSYEDLDKFLQVFDLAEYNQNISNVRVQSITKVQQENSLRIHAKVQFAYKIDSLRKFSQ